MTLAGIPAAGGRAFSRQPPGSSFLLDDAAYPEGICVYSIGIDGRSVDPLIGLQYRASFRGVVYTQARQRKMTPAARRATNIMILII